MIAAAGIQQETPAIDYTAQDCDLMMSVNVTGCFMTAQAAARQMIRFGNGGSIVLIASMSGTVANRVCVLSLNRSSPDIKYFFFCISRREADDIDTPSSRDSSAPPTTPPKPLSCNSAATSPPNGDPTISA